MLAAISALGRARSPPAGQAAGGDRPAAKSFTMALFAAAACDGGVYVSASGAPLFATAHEAGVGPRACAFVNPSASGADGARLAQHAAR